MGSRIIGLNAEVISIALPRQKRFEIKLLSLFSFTFLFLFLSCLPLFFSFLPSVSFSIFLTFYLSFSPSIFLKISFFSSFLRAFYLSSSLTIFPSRFLLLVFLSHILSFFLAFFLSVSVLLCYCFPPISLFAFSSHCHTHRRHFLCSLSCHFLLITKQKIGKLFSMIRD